MLYEQTPKPEKHETKRLKDLVEESQSALEVTLRCLEHGCKEAEDFVESAFPAAVPFIQRKKLDELAEDERVGVYDWQYFASLLELR